MATRNNHNVGLLFTDEANSGLTHQYFAPIIDSVKRTLEAKGYDVMFLNASKANGQHMSYVEKAVQKRLDGVVIAYIDFDDPEVQELLASGIPIVAIDQEIPGGSCVMSDNEGGIRGLTEYIIGMGHKRIAYIHGDLNMVTRIRIKGFLNTCEAHGIEMPKEYLICSSYCDIDKATYYTESLLRLEKPPTCILYSDDIAAIGGINMLRARGMRIPKDISIAGYDGIHMVAQFSPKLTTVKQNTREIGLKAAEKLLAMMENPDGADPTPVVIDTILDEGKTVARRYL